MKTLIMYFIYGAYCFTKNEYDNNNDIKYRSSTFLALLAGFNILAIFGFWGNKNKNVSSAWGYLADNLWIVFICAILLLVIIYLLVKKLDLIDKAISWQRNRNKPYNPNFLFSYVVFSIIILIVSIN